MTADHGCRKAEIEAAMQQNNKNCAQQVWVTAHDAFHNDTGRNYNADPRWRGASKTSRYSEVCDEHVGVLPPRSTRSDRTGEHQNLCSSPFALL